MIRSPLVILLAALIVLVAVGGGVFVHPVFLLVLALLVLLFAR